MKLQTVLVLNYFSDHIACVVLISETSYRSWGQLACRHTVHFLHNAVSLSHLIIYLCTQFDEDSISFLEKKKAQKLLSSKFYYKNLINIKFLKNVYFFFPLRCIIIILSFGLSDKWISYKFEALNFTANIFSRVKSQFYSVFVNLIITQYKSLVCKH